MDVVCQYACVLYRENLITFSHERGFNAFFKTFRLEAAPVLKKVLESCEHCVRQAEGGEAGA
jgi:hypothetical protein